MAQLARGGTQLQGAVAGRRSAAGGTCHALGLRSADQCTRRLASACCPRSLLLDHRALFILAIKPLICLPGTLLALITPRFLPAALFGVTRPLTRGPP